MTRVRTRLLAALAMAGMLFGFAAQAALTVSLELNPDPVRAGERLNARITVTNNGASAVNNVTVESTVVAGIDDASGFDGFYEELLSEGGTCNAGTYTTFCDAGETIIWTVGTLGGGRSITVGVPLPVSATAAAGTVITLPARVLAAGIQAAATSATATVDPDHPLTLEVDDSQDPVAPGATLAYTLSYGNRSLAPVDDLTLAFPLPAGTTFVSASDGGTLVGGNVEWDIGTLADGQTGRRQVVVTANAGLGSGAVLAATATLQGTVGGGAESARGAVVTGVRAGISPRVHVDLNPDPVRAGERLRARITVFNAAATPLTGVVLRAWVPLEIDDASGFAGFDEELLSAGGTCNVLTYTNFCDRDEPMLWSLGTIPAGATAVVTVPLPVAAGLSSGRLVRLFASAATGGGLQASHEDTVGVNDAAALTLELDGSRDVIEPGETFSYRLSVGNRGLDEISETSLVLPLPAGLSVVSAPDGGTVSPGQVEWALGTLFAGQTERREVVVQADPSAAAGSALVVDAAEARGTGLFPELARSSTSGHVEFLRPVDVAIDANPDPVRPGERVRTQVTVSNPGTTTLESVVVTVRVPQEIDDTSGFIGLGEELLSTGGTCNVLTYTNFCDFGEQMTWAIGSIQPGRGVTVTVPLPVYAAVAAGRQIALEALVTAAGDLRSSLESTVAVDNDSPLVLELDDSVDPVVADGEYTYALTFSNRGNAPATNAVLVFNVPEGTTWIASPGGVLSGDTVTWNLGTIQAGAGGRRQVTVHAPLALPGGSLLNAAATLRATSGPFTALATAHAVTRVALSRALSIATSFSPTPVGVAQQLFTTLTVRNDGTAPLTGVVLDARVPLEIDDPAGFVGFDESLLPGGGTCNALTYTNYCDFGELIIWNVGDLAVGASTTLTVPLPVAAATVPGRQVVLEARVRDAASEFSLTDATALIGIVPDVDADSVGDTIDNCLGVANADQRDTDNDGFGNRCDADLNNSGQTNAADLALFRTAFGNVPASALTRNADFNGSGGAVNAADLAIFRTLFGRPPGPSALVP